MNGYSMIGVKKACKNNILFQCTTVQQKSTQTSYKNISKMLKDVGMPQCQKPLKLGVGMAVYRQDRL